MHRTAVQTGPNTAASRITSAAVLGHTRRRPPPQMPVMPTLPKMPSCLSYLALSLPWLCRSFACFTLPVLIQPLFQPVLTPCQKPAPPAKTLHLTSSGAAVPAPAPIPTVAAQCSGRILGQNVRHCHHSDTVKQRGCSRPAPTYSPQRTTLSRRQPCLRWATLTSAVALVPQVGYPQPMGCITNPHQTALHSAAAALPHMGPHAGSPRPCPWRRTLLLSPPGRPRPPPALRPAAPAQHPATQISFLANT